MAVDRRKLAMDIKSEIGAGNKTKEDLLEHEDIKDVRALGRVFSDLRLLGYYPVETDGKLTLMEDAEYEEWQEAEKRRILKEKAEKAEARKKAKTPPKVRYQNKLVRFNNAMVREKTARLKVQNAPDNIITKMRWNITQIQFRIADIEYKDMTDELCKELGLNSVSDLVEMMSNGVED